MLSHALQFGKHNLYTCSKPVVNHSIDMKNQKSILTFALLLGFFTALQAQDIHFSQFYLSPLNLNPAMTGVMNCNVRLVSNYRNQWGSVLRSNSFRTYSVSYDQRIPVGRYDFFGIGGTFWGDRAGTANFQTLTGKLSGSYSKQVSGGRKKASFLVVGAEAGVAQRSIDFLNLRWGTQHDGEGGFDPTLPSQETGFNRDQFIFANLAAGVLFFHRKGDNQNVYVGGAFHHLNQPFVSFRDDNRADDAKLFSRITGHAGGEFPLGGGKMSILPGVIVMSQGPSFQVNGGTSLRFMIDQTKDSQQAFQLGLWARIANKLDAGYLNDALIASTRFDFNDLSLGFSYDINMSSLSTASRGQGAFEFSLVYKICGLERRGVYCPNF
jgi:type IX secretion system PorP/SprF family membrane protein